MNRESPATNIEPQTTAFIGGGNMSRCLIAGLLAGGTPATSIRVAEPWGPSRDALRHDFGVAVFADNADAIAGAHAWVLAVKPQVMRSVCQALAEAAQQQRPLIASIAAGITTNQLDRWLLGGLPIVRAMPNTPALLGAGVTGMYANAQVDGDGRQRAERLLAAAGETVWLADESKMDAVTAVSGSGPAYVFLLAEAMFDAALAEGLPADVAHILVSQTILGGARMLTEDGATAAELRRRVTSPDGTTQAALEVFDAGGFNALVGRAIQAAYARGREISATND
ncbi:MAG: pyrroline-5-carboxylate reductase [Luteimonas sp.]